MSGTFPRAFFQVATFQLCNFPNDNLLSISQPAAELGPRPELGPQPILTTEPDPQPIITIELGPQPILTTEPDPQPILTTELGPRPILATELGPQPILTTEPDPQPIQPKHSALLAHPSRSQRSPIAACGVSEGLT